MTDLLGEGGMARVWRVWHRPRATWCAVKILRPRFAKEPAARRRFMDEARTMVKLSHRNVIQAWEVGDAEPPYLVLEVADGGTLKDWSNRHGPMPARMAVGIAIQVCKGIGAAHRAHVIHRDVNPRNVLVNRKGVCKVSDFGIARIRRDDGSDDVPDATTVHSGDAVGTLGYMAPEQRSDPRRADVRTDVYGIGATLYDLLTCQAHSSLFMAEREPEMLLGIPEVLRPILIKSVAYHPEDRYTEVADLAKALYYARSELQEDPEGTPQLAEGLVPEPQPPQGLTAPLAPGIQPMDDLEVPVTFIHKPGAARNGGSGSSSSSSSKATPESARRSAAGARIAQPGPEPRRSSGEGAPPWSAGGSVSPSGSLKSREASGVTADPSFPSPTAPTWDNRGARARGSRSDSSRSRRIVHPEPSWVSGLEHELPPKRRLGTLLLIAAFVFPAVVLFLDERWVQLAENQANRERLAFESTARTKNAVIVPKLNELYADTSHVDEMLARATTGGLTTQLVAANAYVDRLEEILASIDVAALPQTISEDEGRGKVRIVGGDIGEVRKALSEWEGAVDGWHERARTPCGFLVVQLGIASGPEDELARP